MAANLIQVPIEPNDPGAFIDFPPDRAVPEGHKTCPVCAGARLVEPEARCVPAAARHIGYARESPSLHALQDVLPTLLGLGIRLHRGHLPRS